MGDEGAISGHFVVALTGGIASGKSAACARFAEHGIAVYDADVAAREVVRRGEPAFDAIVRFFGRDILAVDGELDRRSLRQRAFRDPTQRTALEAIVHPHVRAWLRAKVATDGGSYCVLAIPLLAETWPQYAWVDRVVVVDVARELQIERLVRRDDIARELAEAMLAAQATRDQRLELADDVIDNSRDLAHLYAQVDALATRYRELANLAEEITRGT
jgi:dephospho-CoA kinase